MQFRNLANPARLRLAMDDLAPRAIRLHRVNQPGIHRIAVQGAARLGQHIRERRRRRFHRDIGQRGHREIRHQCRGLIPSAKIVKGYEKVEAGMPIYQGVLTDAQIDSIILFIKTLK